MSTVLAPSPERRRLRVRGQVQGVGFRPFVYRLAGELALAGRVFNDGAGVEIEIEGDDGNLDAFVARLHAEAPRLSRIDSVEIERIGRIAPGIDSKQGFEIVPSRGGEITTGVTPDAGICPDCLADMLDPADRRWRYAFTNCTHCGPRYTITGRLPYDRPNTSMAGFVQCPSCRAEYDAPSDRRFHAQPNACPACGPRLALLDPQGRAVADEDPLAGTLARLRAGAIVAVKGLGGFHLVCDARNADAVAQLRQRKNREEKPFAVMFANAASIAPFAKVTAAAESLLATPERPIVLLDKAPGCDILLPGVAPGMATLGVMVPHTPLQVLLFHEASGRPAGNGWLDQPQPLALVMTSANPGGEPLVIDNTEAVRRLAGIADALLVHDRDIVIRCDDSVVRCGSSGKPAFIRRARGYTPASIRLADDGPSVLAVGGFLKNTVCVTRGNEAFLSQHIGSLDNAATCVALEEAVDHLLDVLAIAPVAVAHDLHPDFFSTRFAARFAAEHGVRLIGVQHHHAHIAATLAEHGADAVTMRALGVALDGVGLGDDGTAWGGELLLVDGAAMTRVGHLRELPLPGGDRAAREPWRLAAGVLHLLGRGNEIEHRFPQPAASMVRQMLQQGLNAPLTSSMGRWFDAAAALLDVRTIQSFEGQAPMLLEGLAAGHGGVRPLAGGFTLDRDGVLDLLPLAEALLDIRDPAYGAALFHSTLVDALAAWAAAAARRAAVTTVAFGGGCFLNAILARGLRARLSADGFTVVEPAQAPANDGGLALGQASVARRAVAVHTLNCN
jgi:hydrogenase maturation protein HypF